MIVSLRSPVPLLVAGAVVAFIVVLVVTVISQPSAAGQQIKTATMGDREALSIVAGAMRGGDAAMQVMTAGQARFEDGSWYITVDAAQLHFSQRNRIVVADNDEAVKLMFSN